MMMMIHDEDDRDDEGDGGDDDDEKTEEVILPPWHFEGQVEYKFDSDLAIGLQFWKRKVHCAERSNTHSL